MTTHPQVLVDLGGKLDYVDEELRDVLESLNLEGYHTTSSCQNDSGSGKVWIQFRSSADVQIMMRSAYKHHQEFAKIYDNNTLWEFLYLSPWKYGLDWNFKVEVNEQDHDIPDLDTVDSKTPDILTHVNLRFNRQYLDYFKFLVDSLLVHPYCCYSRRHFLVDLRLKSNQENSSLLPDSRRMLEYLLKSIWSDQEVEIKKVSPLSGLSNLLYFCQIEIKSLGTIPTQDLVIRLKDPEKIALGKLLMWLHYLSEANLCPPIYGTFNNGYVIGYVPGNPVLREDLRRIEVMKSLAKKIHQLHNVKIPSSKSPVVWSQLDKWIKTIPDEQSITENKYMSKKNITAGLNNLRNEVQKYIKRYPEFGKVVFCHNDLTADNIIAVSEQELHYEFIDWEYSGYNYMMFDLVNFLLEWAGNELDYKNLPSTEEKQQFFLYYFNCYDSNSNNSNSNSNSSNTIENFFKKSNGGIPFPLAIIRPGIDIFEDLVNFYWGVWALSMHFDHLTNHSTNFDYLGYGVRRLNHYLDKNL